MNQNSLNNLKLGSLARKKGKVKHHLTVLPEVAEDLNLSENASRFVELHLRLKGCCDLVITICFFVGISIWKVYIAFLYLLRYKVVGFKAQGRGQRAEVECTPLI